MLKKTLSDEFDKILLGSIEESLKKVLGEKATGVLLRHLESDKWLNMDEIPHKIEIFNSCLTELLGSNITQTIERFVIKALSSKLQLEYEEKEELRFIDRVQKLRKRFEG